MIHLPSEDLLTLQNALKQFPTVRQAVLFGSRAKGTHKSGSDVDLALTLEPYSYQDLLLITDTLEEQTTLPYFFDVIELNHIENQALVDHIRRVGQLIYTAENPPDSDQIHNQDTHL